MRTLPLLLLAPMTLLMVSCQTTETAARFDSAQLLVQECIATVAEAESKAQMPQFTDSKDYLLYVAIMQMKNSNAYDVCDDFYIAMIQSDQNKVSGLTRMGTSLGGIGLGLIGVKYLTDGVVDLANGGGSTSTTNISGSRVVSNSSNSSSSGTGLGLANTFSDGRSQSIGGIEPRTLPINGNVTEVNTGSLSGENAPVSTLPVPEQLPTQ